MTFYRFPRSRAATVGIALFFFALIYLARDTLVTSSILGFNRSQVLLVGLIGLAGVVFLLHNRHSLRAVARDPRVWVALAATAAVLLPMVWKRDWQLMYFSILLGIYLAIFLSFFLTCQEAAKYYVAWMTALAGWSLLCLWVLRPLLVDTGLWLPPAFRNQVGVDFYNFGLSFVSQWYVSMRNFGLFREPGVYQYFLILALYLCQFWVSWRRKGMMWLCTAVLAVAAASTLSTAGVAALGLLAIGVFFEKKLYRNKWVWLGIAVLAALLALAWTAVSREQGDLYWELYAMVLGKFQPGQDSGVERLDAVLTDLGFFLHSPLVGGRLSVVLYSVENNAASTPILLGGLGILAGAFHILGWLCLAVRGKGRPWARAVCLAALALSFNTQNLVADVWLWVFPVMALTEWMGPKLSNRKRRA